MNILIADDERLIREMMVTMLRRLNYENLLEAKDGLEALDRIRNNDVSIIIADIRMPGMDGLELLTRVKHERKDIPVIFISGYDLFEYAQKAVKLGAFGYLLKPIKEDELKDTLEQAEKEINAEHEERELLSSLQVKMRKGMQFMQKHFILDLVKEYAYSETFLNNKFGQLGIHLPYDRFAVLYASIDNYYLLTAHMSLPDRDLIKFSLDNIVSELIPASESVVYYFEIEDGLGVLLNFPEHHPLADATKMDEMCGGIVKAIESYTKFTITIGIGSTFAHKMELSKTFDEAQKAVAQRLVKGNNQVLRLSSSSADPTVSYTITPKMERDLQISFEQLDLGAMTALIKEMYASFQNAEVADAKGLMKLNFQLIMLLYKFAIQKDLVPEEALGDEIKLYNQVNSCNNVNEITEWFIRLIQTAFELIRSDKGSSGNHLIDKAKEFIHQHYGDDLSLEIVAQAVYLSPSYLSKCFKEETGENFFNYVLNYRIDVARSLLSKGVYKANQVAEMVGFQDEKYFYKVFKKMTGFTPSEYKRL